jgi:hypothetical protein
VTYDPVALGLCSLTGRALPPGRRSTRRFIDNRARVINGKLTDLESALAELQGQLTPAASKALRARVWRMANLVPVGTI